MNLLPAPRLQGTTPETLTAGPPAAFVPTSADADVCRPPRGRVLRTAREHARARRDLRGRAPVPPHGHFQELVLDAGGVEVRALVTGSAPAVGEAGTVTLREVRHYRDGVLVPDGAMTGDAR